MSHPYRRARGILITAVLMALVISSKPPLISDAQAPLFNIDTLAGGGVGDMRPAVEAALNNPNAIAFDSKGNAYIADTDNNRIRKVSTDGTITTIAGTGDNGLSGDGAAATLAFLNRPRGVAVDSMGNIFIADTSNHRIREIDAMSGNISTVVGTGTRGFAGDGAAATGAQLNFPRSVSVDDKGVLVIADTNNFRIRQVDAMGMITTIAGDGTQGSAGDGAAATMAKLNLPTSVAVDGMGNVFLADSNNHCIRKITPSNMNFITTVAGSGSPGFAGDGMAATSALLNLPTGVTLGPNGSLLIADMGNSRIRQVDAMGNINTVAGSGGRGFSGDGGNAKAAQLDTPFTVTVAQSGDLFIVDSANARIRRVRTTGTTSIITTFAGGGVGDRGAAAQATLQFPTGVAQDMAGSIYIADTENNRIRQVQTMGMTTAITTIAGTGMQGFGGDGGMAVNARLNQPTGLALDAARNIYFADTGNHRIRKIAPSGVITTVAGTNAPGTGGEMMPATQSALRFPFNVSVDPMGSLYVADSGNNRVRKVDPMGIIRTIAGTGVRGFTGDGMPAIGARLNLPLGVAVGSGGVVVVADSGNHRIRYIDAMGIITTIAGTGVQGFGGDGMAAKMALLNFPRGLAVDSVGNIFIADSNNSRIREIDAMSMNISTVVGTGIPGFAGDGSAATNAQLNQPTAVIVDAMGNMIISDSGNNRIRRTMPAPMP